MLHSSCLPGRAVPASRRVESPPGRQSKELQMLKYAVAFSNAIHARVHSERGATAVEYGLIVAAIAAVIVGIVVLLGAKIQAAFTTVYNALP